MNLLAVDTSASACSAALMSKGRVKAEFFADFDQTHARHVMELIHSVLCLAETEAKDIDAYGVTRGPGSFTGLRIGIATVKGMALAYEKPAAGVSSLFALAHPLRASAGLVCSVIDARKAEVYAEAYRFSGTGHEVVLDARVCSAGEIIKDIRDFGKPCLFTGTGAELYRDSIKQELGELASFAPDSHRHIRAGSVAELAYARIASGAAPDPAGLVPCYIRRSDAERARKPLPTAGAAK
ncbi:MAG: tRNA (adenosine(37)-N6)-threonylcarbamoyltransferase complex dimerization subunit type 1 TsaB [Thermodesulfobacteriota bacterium]